MPARKKSPKEKAIAAGEVFQLGQSGIFEFGIGWSPCCDGGLDLDVAAFGYDKDNIVGVTSFMNDDLKDYGVSKSGDNMTGEGDGDDETITIDLDRLNETPLDAIYLLIQVYTATPCNSLFFVPEKHINVYGPYYGDQMQLGHYNMTNNCLFSILGNNIIAGVVRRVSQNSKNFEFVAIGSIYTKFPCCTESEHNTYTSMETSVDALHNSMTEMRNDRVQDEDTEVGYVTDHKVEDDSPVEETEVMARA
jgi:stress response protein SCP2